jgi:hypothetical protein
MVQNTFSDCWPKPLEMDDSRIDKSTTRSWIQGSSLVSVSALKDPGWCHVVFRRPTGVLVFCSRLENPAQSRAKRPETFIFSRQSTASNIKNTADLIKNAGNY